MKQEATQVTDPWRAVKRTAFAVTAGLVPTLIILIAILQVLTEVFGEALPMEVIAWITGAAAFLVLCVTAVTRIMAVPGVNDWLAKLNLEAKPEQTPMEYQPMVEIPDYTPLDK